MFLCLEIPWHSIIVCLLERVCRLRIILDMSLPSTKGCKSFPRPCVPLLTHLGAHFCVFGPHFLLFQATKACFAVWGVEAHVGCLPWSSIFLDMSLPSTKGCKSFPRPCVPLLAHLGVHFYVFGPHFLLFEATKACCVGC